MLGLCSGGFEGRGWGIEGWIQEEKKEQQRMVSRYGASLLLLHPCHVSPWGLDGRQP